VGVFPNAGVSGEMALTDTEIRKAKATGKTYSLNDCGGLYLWITPAGGKLWRWAYRFDGEEKLMLSLGKYSDMPLALARERHAEARKLLVTVTDPMAQRMVQKTAEKAAVENSFQSFAALWLEHWQEGKSPRRSHGPPAYGDTLKWNVQSLVVVELKELRLSGLDFETHNDVFSQGVLSPDFEHGKKLVEMALGEFGIDSEPELSALHCGRNDSALRSGCG